MGASPQTAFSPWGGGAAQGKGGVASSSKIAFGKGGLKWQSCEEVCTHKKGG